jgi:hypothetical protein
MIALVRTGGWEEVIISSPSELDVFMRCDAREAGNQNSLNRDTSLTAARTKLQAAVAAEKVADEGNFTRFVLELVLKTGVS